LVKKGLVVKGMGNGQGTRDQTSRRGKGGTPWQQSKKTSGSGTNGGPRAVKTKKGTRKVAPTRSRLPSVKEWLATKSAMGGKGCSEREKTQKGVSLNRLD